MFRVIEAGPEHWSGILALMGRTPMNSTIPITLLRAQDRTLAYPNLGGEPLAFVACKNDEVIGYAYGRLEMRRIERNGALVPERILFGTDFRLDREYRGSGLASAMMDAVKQAGAKREVRMGYGMVDAADKKTLGVLFGGNVGQSAQIVRTFTNVARLLTARPRVPARPALEAFTPDASTFAQIEEKLSSRFLSPVGIAEPLRALVERYPEIRFYRRADDGRYALALWDQRRVREVTVAWLPRKMAFARQLWNLLRPLTGAHRFPAAGEPFRSAEVFLAARENFPEGFGEMLAREAWDQGCHMLVSIDEGTDPVKPPPVGGRCFRTQSHLIAYSVRGEPIPTCAPERSIYLDLTLI